MLVVELLVLCCVRVAVLSALFQVLYYYSVIMVVVSAVVAAFACMAVAGGRRKRDRPKFRKDRTEAQSSPESAVTVTEYAAGKQSPCTTTAGPTRQQSREIFLAIRARFLF